MTNFEKDLHKYYVLKRYDVIGALLPTQKQNFLEILTTIDNFRHTAGKKDNTYVVVNEDEPYAEVVWKLIEISQTNPKGLKILLSNLDTELTGFEVSE